MSGSLTVLVGAARSGKSTYTTSKLKGDYVVVNSDQVRLAIHGQRYIRLAEPLVHANTILMVRTLFNTGYTVVVDETNTTAGSIRTWLEIDPDLEFIYFQTPREECERRAIASGQPDLVEKGVIKRHFYNIYQMVEDNYPLNTMDLRNDDFFSTNVVMLTLEEIRSNFKAGKV